MGQRAEQLASELQHANQEMITFIEGASDDDLRMTCGDDGRSVAVIAHHVALGHTSMAEWVQTIANGQPNSVDFAMIHDINRSHAETHANVGRDDVVTALRTSGDAAFEILRSLTDDQLARKVPITLFGGQEMSAADVAERILIGHVRSHLADIRGAVESRG